MQVANIFKALGDETRIKIVVRLAANKKYTISELSVGLGLTRQGVRKHLTVLEDAKLVVLKVEGRDTYVLLSKQSFEIAKKFITKLEKQWEERLERLKNLLESN